MSEMDAQQPTLFKQKAGIKSRLNDIPRLCKEIMLAQQSGSTEDVSAMSGLTVALQSIDWKNQYVWSYAWEAIDDMDVDLASEGKSYYDTGRFLLPEKLVFLFLIRAQFQISGYERNPRIILPVSVHTDQECPLQVLN
jgi:hypothetical protein